MKLGKLKAGILALAAAAILCPAWAQAAVTLTYASNGPEQSVRGYAEKLFLDEIEKQSNGQIKVTPFWSCLLYTS